MRKKIEIIFLFTPILLDAIVIILAFIFAYWIRFFSNTIPITKGIPPLRPYIFMSGFAVLVWITLFYLSGLYESKKYYSILDEIYEVIKKIIIGAVIILAPIFFYREFTFSRIVIMLACLLSGILMILDRLVFRAIKICLYNKGIGVKNVCVVGEEEQIDKIIKKINETKSLGYKIIGKIGKNGEKLNYLGELYQLPEIIKKYNIDTIFVGLPISKHKDIAKMILRCDNLNINFEFIPDPYELLTSKIEYYNIDGVPLVRIKEFPHTYWDTLIKRTFDIVGAIFLLLILSPIFLIISILIKLSSKGPVFYKQKRLGMNNKIFEVIKFRTMIHGAEEKTGPVFAKSNDKRVTKIGKILRRLGLDELPQLINVIKGNMSIVGPRPERPEFVEKFSDEIKRYLERHKVRPGITGWAQINGLRGNSSIKERVKYDLYYIENWSMNFDIKILLKTFFATIKGENAY